MYQRTGRWWWRVKLPGEEKAKARPLKEAGAKEATCDHDTAEKLAVEMWEQAIVRSGARQITSECAQKVERLKAQFLDKVRQLTEIVETATTKAQAEAQARAEAEARLNTMIHQAAEPKTASAAVETPNPGPLQPAQYAAPSDTASDAVELVECTVHTDGLQASEDTRPPIQNIASGNSAASDAMETASATPPASSIVIEGHHPQPQSGDCECCGAADIPVTDLECIDSGQLLCQDCFHALHLDISRIESPTFADSHT